MRNQKTSDGWGGDVAEELLEIGTDIPCRIEWAEVAAPKWNVWIFEKDHDLQAGDILISDEFKIAVVIDRWTTFISLPGTFSHYAVNATEHEMSYEELTNV